MAQLAARARDGDLEAVIALGELGRRAVDVLIELLGHEDGTVRELAAESLAEAPDPRAFEPLMAVITDPHESPFVAKEACAALGEIGDRRAVEPLLAVIETHLSGDGDYTGIVAYAAGALGELRDERAVATLTGLLSHESVNVRHTAGEALTRIGTPDAIASARRLLSDDEVRTLIADSLEQAGALTSEEISQMAVERQRDRNRREADTAHARRVVGDVLANLGWEPPDGDWPNVIVLHEEDAEDADQ